MLNPRERARDQDGAAAARPRPSWRSLGIEPVVRLAWWGFVTAGDRAVVWLLAAFSSSARRERRRRAWLDRAVERLAAALGRLKGPFVKAAQFAAHRHDVVPAAAGASLARLRDRVPPLPAARIRRAVEDELGAPIGQLFAEFDGEPLGAASVAQVHRARLPSGEEVAVKVQYPWLEASLPADLAIVRVLLHASARLGGLRRADAERLFQEFSAALREELDFEREAAVAAEIAANLAHDDQIVVPRVVPSHSGRRILTMHLQPAVGVADREGLARLGVAPSDVLGVVARAYAKQVFIDGLFHADPHPGNLFVIDEPGAARRPRVLFVDFGLSRRLEPGLREEMRRGLLALIQRDLDGFVSGMQRMGMIAPGAEGRVRGAVAGMFERIRAHGGALGVAGGQVLALKDEAVGLLRRTDGLQLPHDLLLFAKTLSYVFSLGRELDPGVDLMRLSLPYALRFLAAGASRAPGAPGAGPAGG